MTPREERGLVIAALCKLKKTESDWQVPSQSGAEKIYRVSVEKQTCTCPDHQESGFKCKHLFAVEFTIKREMDKDGNVVETKSMKFTEKVTYKRNWEAYNVAQHTEKHRFQVLLADLCSGIEDTPRKGVGRKPVPMADRLFAVCYKVFTTISSRRFGSDLHDAHAEGYLSRDIHPNKVNCYMEEDDLTPYLKAMIVRSSLPLRAVETDFAVDSSGFSVSKFIRWYDEKYGMTRSGRDWVKIHVVTGVKTGVTTAAVIYDRDTGDGPVLPELVNKTAENFTVKEVSADKAYLSVENVETIHAAGGLPFIAPKANTTGAVGGLFERMFRYYQYEQEKFMKHYHKRSNVESLFSAIKRKFGDSVRSRTPAAMVNETYAKFVCNNLCAVILSQCELGIEAEFWQDQDDGERNIISIRRPS
jgi:transposase